MADETPPLDDARLAGLRGEVEMLAEHAYGAKMLVDRHVRQMRELLAAYDRLRAREAAAMAIVRAVNDKGVYYTLQNGRRCYFCEAETDQFTSEPPHKSDCPVTKARALLGQSE